MLYKCTYDVAAIHIPMWVYTQLIKIDYSQSHKCLGWSCSLWARLCYLGWCTFSSLETEKNSWIELEGYI